MFGLVSPLQHLNLKHHGIWPVIFPTEQAHARTLRAIASLKLEFPALTQGLTAGLAGERISNSLGRLRLSEERAAPQLTALPLSVLLGSEQIDRILSRFPISSATRISSSEPILMERSAKDDPLSRVDGSVTDRVEYAAPSASFPISQLQQLPLTDRSPAWLLQQRPELRRARASPTRQPYERGTGPSPNRRSLAEGLARSAKELGFYNLKALRLFDRTIGR